MNKQIIGLVGPIASGKGAVAKILGKQGYLLYSLSDRIREEMKNKGIEVTRENTQNTANNMRKNQGSAILARKTAELIDSQDPEKVAIDSIRNPEEAKFLKSHFDMTLIGVVADQKKRFELMKIRNFKGDPATWEEFIRLDNIELEQTGDYKQQVNKTLALADTVIENNGTIEELEEKVSKILS